MLHAVFFIITMSQNAMIGRLDPGLIHNERHGEHGVHLGSDIFWKQPGPDVMRRSGTMR